MTCMGRKSDYHISVMSKITVTELARGLSEVINRATYRGEEFLVFRGGKPVVRISPVPSGVRMKDLPAIFDGGLPPLDAGDLDDFARDLDRVRKEMNEPVGSSWDS